MKSETECMDIVNTYLELGSYRGAGDLCGVDHKTVKRVLQRWRGGNPRRAEDDLGEGAKH